MLKYQTSLSSGQKTPGKDKYIMASLRTPLLVALILLAVVLQTSDAGEPGEQEGGHWNV